MLDQIRINRTASRLQWFLCGAQQGNAADIRQLISSRLKTRENKPER